MSNYITVERAQELADERLNVDAWEEAKETDGSTWGDAGTLCVKAITMATAIIDRLNYRGQKTSDAQVNEFPRGGDESIPTAIEIACFEIALALLDGKEPEIEFENLSLTAQGYANVRTNYDRSMPDINIVAGVPSVTAWRYLAPYLRDPSLVRLSRKS